MTVWSHRFFNYPWLYLRLPEVMLHNCESNNPKSEAFLKDVQSSFQSICLFSVFFYWHCSLNGYCSFYVRLEAEERSNIPAPHECQWKNRYTSCLALDINKAIIAKRRPGYDKSKLLYHKITYLCINQM